ncbi:hypothetical protein, partial [Actibacterium pelagium]|uniref:hypothetical protein n=1 Tax=Actibacterium pelagium TaxID=2029103 RepID=UPI001E4CD0E3
TYRRAPPALPLIVPPRLTISMASRASRKRLSAAGEGGSKTYQTNPQALFLKIFTPWLATGKNTLQASCGGYETKSIKLSGCRRNSK